MKQIIILTLSIVAGLSQGFFFGSSGRQEAVSDIDSLCEAKAKKGQCSFYTCFDLRHPCETHNWALSYGWRYCMRFNQERARFTEAGKKWITATRLCTMKELLKFYRQSHVNCEDVEDAMKSAHAQCEHDNGVCETDMLMDNKEPLTDVYKFSRRAAVRFLGFVKECGETGFEKLSEWVCQQGTKLDSIMDFFKDLVN